MSRDYKKLLRIGEEAQLEKLCLREDKGDFPRDLQLLLKLLSAEIAELSVAMYMYDLKEVRLEAADAANYAHMIIIECERRLEDAG